MSYQVRSEQKSTFLPYLHDNTIQADDPVHTRRILSIAVLPGSCARMEGHQSLRLTRQFPARRLWQALLRLR